jgi:hypothetical protein
MRRYPFVSLILSVVGLAIVASLAVAADPPIRLLKNAERVIPFRGLGHFPVMIKLRDGALLAAFRAGAGSLGIGGRLDVSRSADGGKTWSKPVMAIDSPWDDRNPSLGQMPDGAVVLAYTEMHSYTPDGKFDLKAGPCFLNTVASADGGKTWTAKRQVESPFADPSPYGKIHVTKGGMALLSLYQLPSNRVAMLRSTDSGKTWKDPTFLPGHHETQIFPLDEKQFLAFTRIEEEKTPEGILLSESQDGGRTWIHSRNLFKAKQWPCDVTALKSGSLLLTHGARQGRGKSGAGVVLSKDNGKTWDAEHGVLIGWDSLNDDTGYPTTVQLDDGTIVTMYYAAGTEQSPDTQAIVVRYTEQQLLDAMK